ncbi:MAG: PH domain-containing protein [Victivallales bacterium]|nr:PH domain-containing protein [Victivallales bacterium]
MGIFSRLIGKAGVVDNAKLAEEYAQLLAEDETVEVGFVLVRDKIIFTNQRLIFIDIQGMTGKKVEYLSVPYSKVTKFSVETAGHFDLDADLKIWVGNNPSPIQKKFNRSVNVYDVQRVLAQFTR